MLELIDLRCGYDHTTVLSSVQLTCGPGQLIALIGPNGSGKSTLLKSIARIQPLLGGTIILDGKPIQTYRGRTWARHIAYQEQTHQATSMDVDTLLLHARYPYHGLYKGFGPDDYKAIEEAVQRVGIAHLRNKRLNTLSGGELKRVHLAFTLARKTPYLLLDEPQAHLDLALHHQTLEILASVAQEGACVLFVAHDIALAVRYATRVLVCCNSCIADDCTPKALLESTTLERTFSMQLSHHVWEGESHYVWSPLR